MYCFYGYMAEDTMTIVTHIRESFSWRLPYVSEVESIVIMVGRMIRRHGAGEISESSISCTAHSVKRSPWGLA